jgi:molybdopterin molybdotransferase
MSLMTVASALAQLLQSADCRQDDQERLIEETDGFILSRDVVSSIDVPPFSNSAMDGYAVRAEDVAVGQKLPIGQIIAAGATGAPHQAGSASRIFTGAPMPLGADSVLIQEDAEALGDHIVPTESVTAGDHVRTQGQDIEQGAAILPRGRRLRPADLALAASVGLETLPVYQPLRVAILSTGDELVEPPAQLAPGQIYNSNRRALAASIKRLGMVPVDLGIVPDDETLTQLRLREAAEQADVVMTTGGVSVGDRDFVKQSVSSAGELELWKLAIKPGKPLAFGKVHGKPFFGLPGNPVSSIVTFVALATPYLLKKQGATDYLPMQWPGVAAFDFEGGGRQEYLRVQLRPEQDEVRLHLYPQQGSGVMSSLAWADALAIIEPGRAVREGDPVQYLSLR